jgi:hypothetical protein
MIENTGKKTTSNPLSERAVLELKSVIRTLRFIEDKTNYDHQKRDGLFTLQPRLKKHSSQLVQCGIQKRLPVSYIQRYDRLSIKQQGFSSESCTAYTIIYAKNTKPNCEGHKVVSSSVCGSKQKGFSATIRGTFEHFESNKSRALPDYEKAIRINLISLKLSSVKTILNFCFNGFRMIKILSLDLNFMRVKELKFNSFESIKKPYAIYSLLTSHTDHYIEL